MDEQDDRAARIAGTRVEEIEAMTFAGPIGEIEFAAGFGTIGRRIPLPAGDMNRVLRHARPIVVLGLEIDPFRCHRAPP